MLETLNTVIVSMDIFGIVIDVFILGWFYYTYRKNPGAVMGKYTKILIAAILLSLANKVLLGNIMFISFVEIGLVIYALYMITRERNRYY